MLHALLMLAQALTSPPDQIDIPVAYRGRWALDTKFCAGPGPAVVQISARHVDFYERHGVLDVAQLNYAGDPPTFHGSFRFVEFLHFSSEVVRFEQQHGLLFITEDADPEARTNPVAWHRCPGA